MLNRLNYLCVFEFMHRSLKQHNRNLGSNLKLGLLNT